MLSPSASATDSHFNPQYQLFPFYNTTKTSQIPKGGYTVYSLWTRELFTTGFSNQRAQKKKQLNFTPHLAKSQRL